MAGKATKRTYALILLLALLLSSPACGTQALADDAELLRIIPGQWSNTYDAEAAGEEPQERDAFVTFEEDGTLSVRWLGRDGAYAYSCGGTWSFELVTGGMDRLTLLFTSTDNPSKAGTEYRVECVYNVYSESWLEDDTEHTYLLLEEEGGSGISPFEEVYGYDGAALHREKGPNMRVVNCSSYVSLRAERSKTSARLAKVPLGAQVLAFPEAGDEGGFILCVYHDEYGYILSEYLQPAE